MVFVRLLKILRSFETDINSYIWSDTDNTILNVNEKPLENRTNIYKTKSVTPALQKLYKCLDEDLNKIICDIENITKGESSAQSAQNNDLKILLI